MLVAAALVAATRTSYGDPSCYTTRSLATPPYAGQSASRVYDWVDVQTQTSPRFTPDQDLPAALLEDRYVPQGLAGWPDWDDTGDDLLLVSAYHDVDGDQNADGPSAVFALAVAGPRAGTSPGRMLIGRGHVGGLAVYRDWLYVGSGHQIRGWRLTTVRHALTSGLDGVQPPDYVRASDYEVGFLGVGDGQLWAGQPSRTGATPLSSYRQTDGSTGALHLLPDAGISVPEETQGLAVTSDTLIVSTSYGRLSRGKLWVLPRGRPGAGTATPYCLRVPSMNEGVAVLNDRVYLVFESGARTYTRGLIRSVNPIDQVHSAALTDVTSLDAGGPPR